MVLTKDAKVKLDKRPRNCWNEQTTIWLLTSLAPRITCRSIWRKGILEDLFELDSGHMCRCVLIENLRRDLERVGATREKIGRIVIKLQSAD